ncbi:Uncharacterised protein [Vibrio cholerae]|nr:Uncharacterised protein [Vibrio cholerae]CSB73723.1 Uncharacterised protein [Vibrio cholerae]
MENHEATITDRIDKPAAYVGVKPTTNKVTNTASGIKLCQPDSSTFINGSWLVVTICTPMRLASIRTKNATDRK